VRELDAIAAQAAIPAYWSGRTAGPMSVRFKRTSGFRFVQNAVNLYESDKIVDMAPLSAVALDRVRAWIDEAK
jgi:hypothetical protein